MAALEAGLPLTGSLGREQGSTGSLQRLLDWVDRHGLWAVVALALLTRLYSVTAPLTDGGHERQTQVAMIARNLYRDHLNILYPRMDTFAPQPGYALLEFPLQPALMALVYYVTGVRDVVGRLLVVVFSTASVIAMYGISRFYAPRRASLAAAALYALTPLSIYFGRAVFPEALWLFFALFGMYSILAWQERQRRRDWALACVCAMFACLEKAPPGLMMLLPMAAAWWVRWRVAALRRLDFYAFFGLAVVPLAAWALWSRAHSVTVDIGFSPYRVASLERWGIPEYWFSPVFYRFVAGSLLTVGLTPIGTILALLGAVQLRSHRLASVAYSWIAGMAIYVILTPGAQATHWNYHVPLIPVGALCAAVALASWSRFSLLVRLARAVSANPPLKVILIAVALVLHAGIYAEVVRTAYAVDRRIPLATKVGRIVDATLSTDGFVALVQPGVVPATQAYYMNRRINDSRDLSFITSEARAAQWVEDMRKLGATGLVAVDNPHGSGTTAVRQATGLVNYLDRHYRHVESGDGYIIYDLAGGRGGQAE